jgi:hypothetical protein
LGTDVFLIPEYEIDRDMVFVLFVSNIVVVIKPIMKEEFKIARANGVAFCCTKRIFRNPTFEDYSWILIAVDMALMLEAFTIKLIKAEWPILFPQRAPAKIPVEEGTRGRPSGGRY